MKRTIAVGAVAVGLLLGPAVTAEAHQQKPACSCHHRHGHGDGKPGHHGHKPRHHKPKPAPHKPVCKPHPKPKPKPPCHHRHHHPKPTPKPRPPLPKPIPHPPIYQPPTSHVGGHLRKPVSQTATPVLHKTSTPATELAYTGPADYRIYVPAAVLLGVIGGVLIYGATRKGGQR